MCSDLNNRVCFALLFSLLNIKAVHIQAWQQRKVLSCKQLLTQNFRLLSCLIIYFFILIYHSPATIKIITKKHTSAGL